MAEYIATVKAKLDDSEISKKIKSIESNNITLNNFIVNPSNIAREIQRALNSTTFTISNISIPNISRQMQTQGQDAGRQFSHSFNVGMSELTTEANNATNTIQHMRQTLANMKIDRSGIDTVTRDLESMNIAISRITTRINGNALNVRVNGIDELGRAVTIVKEFDYESGRVRNVGKTISQEFDTGAQAAQRFADTLERANTAMQTGGLDSAISGVQAKFEQLGHTGHERLSVIAQDITQLTVLQEQMANSTSDDVLVQSYEAFNQTLQRVQNNLRVVSNYTKTFASEAEVSTLQNKIETWLSNNSRAAKTYGVQLNGYINSLKNMNATGNRSRSTLNMIAEGFKQVDNAATAAGIKGKTFGDKLKGAFSSISRYVSASTLIYTAIRAIRTGISTVVDLDTALVDLRKTTDGTEEQLKSFYKTANSMAKSLGVSTKDVIQAAADWSRLGLNRIVPLCGDI